MHTHLATISLLAALVLAAPTGPVEDVAARALIVQAQGHRTWSAVSGGVDDDSQSLISGIECAKLGPSAIAELTGHDIIVENTEDALCKCISQRVPSRLRLLERLSGVSVLLLTRIVALLRCERRRSGKPNKCVLTRHGRKGMYAHYAANFAGQGDSDPSAA